MLLLQHLTQAEEMRTRFSKLCVHRLLQALFISHLRLRDIWEVCSEIMVTCCPNGIEPVHNLLGKTANTNIKSRVRVLPPQNAFLFPCDLFANMYFLSKGQSVSDLSQTPDKTLSLQNNLKMLLQGGLRHCQHGQSPKFVYIGFSSSFSYGWFKNLSLWKDMRAMAREETEI